MARIKEPIDGLDGSGGGGGGGGDVPSTRSISAGTGLTGGGDFSADRTIAMSGATLTSISDAQDTADDAGSAAVAAQTTANTAVSDAATAAAAASTLRAELEAGTYKRSVRLATTAALAANTRTGNVLTMSANGALANIDGVAPALGDSILVNNEVTGANNGLYTVTVLGDAGTPAQLTRRSDADATADWANGAQVRVREGAQAGSTWFNGAVATLNTTAIAFTRASAGGTNSQIQFRDANGDLSGADYAVIDGENLALPRSAVPSAYSAGVKLWASQPAANFPDDLWFRGSSESRITPSPLIGDGCQFASVSATGTSTSLNFQGAMTFASATGTRTNPSPSDTSALTRRIRWRVQSGAGAGSQSLEASAALWSRGAAAGRGGFRLRLRGVGWALLPATAASFHGVSSLVAPVAASSYTQFVNCVGIGGDLATDSGQLCVITNDNAGNAVPVPLSGSTMATTAFYDADFFCADGGTAIEYAVQRRDAAGFWSGTISSELPVAATYMGMVFWATNLATASAITYEVSNASIRSPIPS